MIDLNGVAVADLHFRSKDLHIIKKAFNQFVSEALEKDAEIMLIAGDVFDDGAKVGGRENTVGSCQIAIINELTRFTETPFIKSNFGQPQRQVYIIPGNHDLAGAGQMDGLACLNERAGIHVIRHAKVINHKGFNILCLPWLIKSHLKAKLDPDADLDKEFQERIESIVQMFHDAPRPKILLGHCEIVGSMLKKYSLIGGSFELTRAHLQKIGADLTVLGHIHQRQENYLGSLCQLRFDEENNPTGYLHFNFRNFNFTPTVTLVDRKFCEIDSRRFWNITTETHRSDTEFIAPGDWVKIKLKKKDIPVAKNDLLERYGDAIRIFTDPIREDEIIERRSKQDFTPEDEPAVLFFNWCRETGNLVKPEEEKIFITLIEENTKDLETGPIGSLDRINRIILKNIGGHRSTEIDLTGMNGLIGISGPNGVGKTFILEAIMAAGYGEFPSRPGALLNRISWGHLGDALLEVEEVSNGETYILTRKLRKTASGGTQEGYIEKVLTGGIRTAIAGPKVADATRAAKNILGDPTIFKATTFASQELVGDFISARPGERKEVLAGMLGSERLLEIGKNFHDRVGEIKVNEGAIRRLINEHENWLTRTADTQEKLNTAQTAIDGYNERLELLRMKNNQLRQTIQELEAQKRDLNRLDEEREKILEEIATIENKKITTLKMIAFVHTQLKSEDILLLQASKLTELDEKLNSLNQINAALKVEYEKKSDIEAMLKQADADFYRKRSQIETYQLPLERSLSALKGELKRAQSMAGLKDDPYFTTEKCPECPLLAGARNAARDAENIKKGILEKELKLAEVPNEIRRAQDERDAEVLSLLEQMEPLVKEINNKKHELEQGEYEKLINQRPTLIEAREKLQELEVLKGNLPYLEDKISEFNQDLKILQEKLATLRAKLTDGVSLDSYLEAKSRDKLECTNRIEELDLNRANTLVYIGELQHQMKEREEKKREIDTKSDELIGIIETGERLRLLEKAFSKNGIPQYVVDTALPQIHDCLDRVMGVFEGRFGIKLKTQGETTEGNLREELLVIITNQNSYEADISEYSGGEKKILRTIFRVAMTLFQAQRRGRRHKVFFSDEAFDMLDAEYTSGLQEVFRMMEGELNQVILSSHSDTLLAEIENKITLSVGADGTIVD